MNMVEAIEFPTFVEGIPVTASVVEIKINPVQHCYRIEFSDGYEDVFTMDEGMIEGDNGQSSKPYIKAIRHDLPQVIGLDTNKFYHIFQDKVDGILTNIWIIEKEDEDDGTYYGVYYNGYYRFEYRQVKNEWICSTRSKAGDSINAELVEKVKLVLYSLL